MKHLLLRKAALLLLAALTVSVMILPVSAAPRSALEKRLSTYDFELYMAPIWEAGTVYQENAVFYVDGDGNVGDVTLLYKPETVLSVRRFGLKNVFTEGEDYVVTETGIALTEGSSIPVMPRSAYCDESNHEASLQLKDGSGGAIKADNTVMPKYYLAITYTTKETWNGTAPFSELDRLPITKHKLENKEPLAVSIIGDSISVGYSASGLNDPSYRVDGSQITASVNVSPFMPIWPKQVVEALKRAYDYDDVALTNWAIGGTSTTYGPLNDMMARVIDSKPDLIVIGFGMNEYWSPASQHTDRIEAMLDKFRAALPDVEFVLLSSMLPNMMVYSESNVKLAEFEEAYYGLQAKRADLPIAVAPLNSVYRTARDVKGDFAMVGGNQNHPNDFTIRLYAQTVSAVLGVYDDPWIIEGLEEETAPPAESAPEAVPGPADTEPAAATPRSGYPSLPLVAGLAAAAVVLAAAASAIVIRKFAK